jgi:hypothetical protein
VQCMNCANPIQPGCLECPYCHRNPYRITSKLNPGPFPPGCVIILAVIFLAISYFASDCSATFLRWGTIPLAVVLIAVSIKRLFSDGENWFS